MIGDHPVPGPASLAAGKALSGAGGVPRCRRLALVLVSGGGSALAEGLAPGVTLDQLIAVTTRMLHGGAPIDMVNAARRRLSLLKGGGLARAAAPARVVTLVLSDVVGDRVDVIASGPTVTGEDDDITVVGNGDAAADAAARAARSAGLAALVVDTALQGDAALRAIQVIEECRQAAGDLFVYAGETTVTVTGPGRGGRNQEAALAAALHLAGTSDVTFLAAGTDGVDGTTTAAGAVVDGATVERGRSRGRDAAAFLAANDSGGYFDGAAESIVTGPTGTNVGDLWMVLRG